MGFYGFCPSMLWIPSQLCKMGQLVLVIGLFYYIFLMARVIVLYSLLEVSGKVVLCHHVFLIFVWIF
jgi:hypothetical protein